MDLTKAGNTPLMVAGNLSLSRMPRLCAALADSGGQVSVDLQLFKEGGLAVVSGRVQASLGLTCQRCFRPMRYPVDATMRLAWSGSPQSTPQVPGSYEQLDSNDGRVKLAELVEDELLLALPLAARHAKADDCSAQPARRMKTKGVAAPGTRPFEILKTLRRH
ncbi:MAG: DUF177 domain-containing protein [Gammaproteobacteria bacterium]|nr:DUF177 domain-containing protein [Gammaproteobacteria bacterium]MDE2109182.1 DUF177 domain-containing protein [Gammaproteobacteria bacterium]